MADEQPHESYIRAAQSQAILSALGHRIDILDYEDVSGSDHMRMKSLCHWDAEHIRCVIERREYMHPVTHPAWAARNRTWFEDADGNEIADTEGGE